MTRDQSSKQHYYCYFLNIRNFENYAKSAVIIWYKHCGKYSYNYNIVYAQPFDII